ncbi:MAG: hypothetical protein EXR57_04550 [Dehalococcoidia bacterium]|nr:hypothetical protein [Dehalococcoidia bacterium]MSQ35070.1 hypothetical protein [Dehalococcoidia bacterium]
MKGTLALEMPGLPVMANVELENALRKLIAERGLPLYRMMGFQLGWVDEKGEPLNHPSPDRTHGALALASAQAVSGDFRPAIRYAVAVELVENFSEIHVDVEDGNTERAGRSSIWWTWGPAQAINAGDGMHAMARLALYDLRLDGTTPDRVAAALKTLDEATLRLCEGEYLDIAYQERLALSVNDFLEMAEARSGALFGCAARLGAMASPQGTPQAADSLAEFGSKLGTARQVAGDIAAFWGEHERDQVQQGRLIAKKKNLPVVHAMATADATTRRRLGDLYVQRVLDPSAIKTVAGMLEASGSRRFAQDTLARLLAEADSALASAGLDQKGTEMLRMAARQIAGATG